MQIRNMFALLMKCSLKDKDMVTALKQSLGSNCLLVMERTRTNKSNLIFF